MRITDKFFEDLCLLAKKHGMESVGTVVARVGRDGDIEVELPVFSQTSISVASESVWEIQKSLMAYGFQRERFPVSNLLQGPELDEKRVIFRPKGPYQKDDCFSGRDGCSGASTLEAVLGTASIRTCENPACKETAAETAIRADDFFRRS